MPRRLGGVTEALAMVASATLAGVACCGPVVIQWLGLLVWGIGGRMLLVWLLRYEIPVLMVIGAASFLGRMLAGNRPTRWANTLLAGVAFVFAFLRALWEIRRGIVMAIDPVLTVFSYRQSVLLVAAGLVFAVRLGLLVATLWRRASPIQGCRLPLTAGSTAQPARLSTSRRDVPGADV